MPHLLIKLYGLEDDWRFITEQKEHGITVRKPIGPEKHLIVNWVSDHFSTGWAAETGVAISNRPISCFVAVRQSAIIGFACYDATALGFFGPVGVAASNRGRDIGQSLLKAGLLDMKLKGYGHPIVGDANDTGFYQKVVDVTEIPDSSPGVYLNRIKQTDQAG